MKLNLKALIFLFIGLIISFNGLIAQTNYESEEDMIKAAKEMFEEGQYSKAMPLYSQLVSLYPKEAVYNMNYGVCLMHAERDKKRCLKYLKYAASKSEAGPISNYYYAKALHSNYELNRAIKYYNKYRSSGNSKEVAAFNVYHPKFHRSFSQEKVHRQSPLSPDREGYHENLSTWFEIQNPFFVCLVKIMRGGLHPENQI